MSVTWVRLRARQWALLPGALVALGCATDPDGVASVAVTPSTLSFATIHAPAETITVTVTGTNGRIRTDIPVTWTFWESSGDPIATSRVIVIQRAANSANRWTVRPFGEPGVSFYYANAGGQRTPPLSAAVWAGPR
ncbi:MAG: hypothetical protein IPP90_14725 [Gemmatimonadaceae bacterium]|nr:hypothetical protein [Gemmatimonadaceae bacterium]